MGFFVHSELVVTREADNEDLELTRAYRKLGHEVHEIPMSFKFDVRAVKILANLLRRRLTPPKRSWIR